MLTHIHIWNDVLGEGETGKSRSWPGPCTNTQVTRYAHGVGPVAEGMGKDCSRQSFCIPAIPGGHAESDVVENI